MVEGGGGEEEGEEGAEGGWVVGWGLVVCVVRQGLGEGKAEDLADDGAEGASAVAEQRIGVERVDRARGGGERSQRHQSSSQPLFCVLLRTGWLAVILLLFLHLLVRPASLLIRFDCARDVLSSALLCPPRQPHPQLLRHPHTFLPVLVPRPSRQWVAQYGRCTLHSMESGGERVVGRQADGRNSESVAELVGVHCGPERAVCVSDVVQCGCAGQVEDGIVVVGWAAARRCHACSARQASLCQPSVVVSLTSSSAMLFQPIVAAYEDGRERRKSSE